MRNLARVVLYAIVATVAMFSTALAAPIDDATNAYRHGDYAAALQILRPIADQGDPLAQYAVGEMYHNGEGVGRDYAQAMNWFRKAADQGHVLALVALGVMYAKGEGVPSDYVLAHMWLDLSAQRSPPGRIHDMAVQYRGLVAAKMTSEQIAQARDLAREWKPK